MSRLLFALLTIHAAPRVRAAMGRLEQRVFLLLFNLGLELQQVRVQFGDLLGDRRNPVLCVPHLVCHGDRACLRHGDSALDIARNLFDFSGLGGNLNQIARG